MGSWSDAVEITADVVEWPQAVQLNNGNLFIPYRKQVNGDRKGFFTILQHDGTEVKAETEFAAAVAGTNGEIKAVHLANNNVMLIYCDGVNIVLQVYDSDGVSVVGATNVKATSDGTNIGAVLLNNNNVFFVFRDGDVPTNNCYYAIYTAACVQVVASTQFCSSYGNRWYEIALCSDGNVAIAYLDSADSVDYYLSMRVFDEDGVSQLGVTNIRDEGFLVAQINTVGLSNGNILIAYEDFTNGKYQIRKQDGTEVKAETTFSLGRTNNISIAQIATTAFITFLDDTATGSCKYAVIANDGTINTAETEFIDSAFFTNTHKLNALQVVVCYDGTASFKIYTADLTFVQSTYKKKLVAIADNTIYYEDSPGSMVEVVAAAGSLDTTKDVAAFRAFQKIFIANDTTFKVLDFGNVKLSTADIGGNIPHIGNILTGEDSLAQIVVDFITTDVSPAACLVFGRRLTVATFVNTETVKGVNDAGNNISFDLDADEVLPDPPHYYDWTPYANDTDTYGEMPTRATLGCLYRGRGVLSGHPDYPHQWYMSRQGNLWDWAYIASDAQAPVAGNDANAGEIGDIVTALTPYHDDFLNFGCASSIWLLSSDPCAGGSIRQISNVTGIWSQTAQCFDEVGNLVFLGAGGVYKIPYEALVAAAAGEFAQNITKFKFPSMIADLNLDLTTHKITMQYDVQRYGVIIGVTTLANGTNTNYWLDLRTEDWGIFPESYPTNAAMYAAYYYNSIDPAYSGLLLGGKDGYIRIFDDSTKNDDTGTGTQAIESHVVMGPQFIGADADKESRLTSLSFTTALNTDNLFYQIFADDTAEEIITAINASPIVPLIAGTLTDYTRPIRIRQGVRGTFVALRIGNDMIDKSWSTEIIVGNVVSAGRK